MAVEGIPGNVDSPEPTSYTLPPSNFFGSLPTDITRTPASCDSDVAVAQTIRLMVDAIERDAAGPVIQKLSAGVRPWIRRDGTRVDGWFRDESIHHWNERPQLYAFWFPKTHITFVNDESLLKVALGIPTPEEFLISPARLVTMPHPRGDCDDFTMVVCCLLRAMGLRYEIVTVAANPNYPREFSHVYARAVFDDGSRLVMDASHGDAPGWEVPADRVTRKQVWPVGCL